MLDLQALGISDFEPLVGRTFVLTHLEEHRLELVLVEAAAKGAPVASGRRPFSLVFRGPGEPILAQQIYRLGCEGFGAVELFLVPLGPGDGGILYEAAFNYGAWPSCEAGAHSIR